MAIKIIYKTSNGRELPTKLQAEIVEHLNNSVVYIESYKIDDLAKTIEQFIIEREGKTNETN
jgi:hypothetical protein